MSMYDYLLKFADEATAESDPVMAARYYRPPTTGPAGDFPGAWAGDRVIPGVQVWDPANDTTVTIEGPNGSFQAVKHQYLDGFWLVIAETKQLADLDSHPNLLILADRDDPNATWIIDNTGDPNWRRHMMQPLFAGSEYLFTKGQ